MPQQKNRSFLLTPFCAPFKGLLLVVWVFFVCAFMAHPYSPILKGGFYDPDDLIHGVRFIDWMNGQSWFDPLLHRLAPPEGVISHFSRLSELPLFFIAAPAHALGLSWMGATLVAGALYPLALFMGFLFVLRATSRLSVGASWANSSAFIALFSSVLLFQFAPGRIDHHGLAMLLVLASLHYVLRSLRAPRQPVPALAAGFLLGLCQAVALETLPWILLFAAWVGFWLVFDGPRRVKSALVFALSYYLSSALFLLIAKSPSSFFTLDVGFYSFLYVILAASIAFVILLNGLASYLLPRSGRFILALSSCALTGGLFLHSFPELMAGPYGGVDARIYAFLTNYIGEAEPFIKKLDNGFIGMFLLHGYALLCLGTGLSYVWKKRTSLKAREWIFWGILVVVSAIFALFYQSRFIFYLYLFSIIPLTAFFKDRMLDLANSPMSRQRLFSEILLVLLVGPLFSVFLPSLIKQGTVANNILLFPADISRGMRMPGIGILRELNDPSTFGKKPLLIMNTLDEGAPILFYTDHMALAAPYHMNVKGNLKAMAFFGAATADDARKILKESQADMVLMAKDTYSSFNKPFSRPNPSRMSQEEQRDVLLGAKTFGDKLAHGETPAWLSPVWVMLSGEYLLFKVEKDKL